MQSGGVGHDNDQDRWHPHGMEQPRQPTSSWQCPNRKRNRSQCGRPERTSPVKLHPMAQTEYYKDRQRHEGEDSNEKQAPLDRSFVRGRDLLAPKKDQQSREQTRGSKQHQNGGG